MRCLRWACVLLAGWLVACDEECQTSQDCPSGRYQCRDNKCVLPPDTPLPDLGFPPQIDVGFRPDMGFPDLGFRPDFGFVTPPDAGFEDADLTDQGPIDSGGASGPLTDVEALVEVAVIQDNLDGGPRIAQARFVDYSSSGRMISQRTQQGCTIIERGEGSGVGLTATEIVASNVGTNPARTVRMAPVTPGLFRNPMPPPTDPGSLLVLNTDVEFRIVPTAAAGALGAATVTLPLVLTPVAVLFSPSDPSQSIRFAAVNLAGPAGQGANRFEMYDEDRRIVVSCPITVNSTGLPNFISGLYQSGIIVTLDVRSQAETVQSVPVQQRGSIPVTFRVARTVRLPVIIP